MRKSSEAKNPIDWPIPRLVTLANQQIEKGWTVYFKFSCPYCGERCMFRDANQIYPEGECAKCGEKCEVDSAGFMLASQLLPNVPTEEEYDGE